MKRELAVIMLILIFLIIIILHSFSFLLYYHGNQRQFSHSSNSKEIRNIYNLTVYEVSFATPYDRNTTLFEGVPSHVYFIPVKTGFFILNVTTAIVVPPSVYHCLLLVTTSGPMNLANRQLCSCQGCVYAINISNGEIVWFQKFNNQIMTQPIVINCIVIIGLGNNIFQNCHVRGTGDNAIIALNATNGEILWEYKTLGEDMPTPTFYNGKIIEANGNGQVFALNLQGEVCWCKNITSYDSMSSPLLVNGVVYFGSANPYIFWAINAANGNIIWYVNFSSIYSSLGGLDDSSPAYCNGIIVSAYTIKVNCSIKEILFAVNATNGKILWCIDEGCTKIPPNLESPPPTIFNGVVYHDSPVGILYAVNLTSGKIIWAFKTGFTVDNPEIYEGKIIIQNASGYLFVLSYQGNLLKGFQTPVMPGPGNMLLTCNSLILVGVNGIVDSLPLYCLT